MSVCPTISTGYSFFKMAPASPSKTLAPSGFTRDVFFSKIRSAGMERMVPRRSFLTVMSLIRTSLPTKRSEKSTWLDNLAISGSAIPPPFPCDTECPPVKTPKLPKRESSTASFFCSSITAMVFRRIKKARRIINRDMVMIWTRFGAETASIFFFLEAIWIKNCSFALWVV